MKSYHEIVQKINYNYDISGITQDEINDVEKIFSEHIFNLDKNDDHEDISIAYCYWIIFLSRTNKYIMIDTQDKLTELYTQMKKKVLTAEKKYKVEVKGLNKDKKKKVVCRLLAFYKLIQFYLSLMEKSLLLNNNKDLVSLINIDRLYFIEKQHWAEGDLKGFISYSRLFFISSLKNHQFIYDLIGIIGIVLIWQGIWGLTDLILLKLNIAHHPMSYFVTTIIGIFLLYVIGGFTRQTVGLNEDEFLEHLEIEEMQEIKKLTKIVEKKKSK